MCFMVIWLATLKFSPIWLPAGVFSCGQRNIENMQTLDVSKGRRK